MSKDRIVDYLVAGTILLGTGRFIYLYFFSGLYL